MKHFLRNVGTGYAEAAVVALVHLLLTPLLVARLGVAGYGLWVLSAAVAYYFHVLDFGLGEAQVRFLAHFEARGLHQAQRRLTATVLTALTLCGLLAAVLAVLVACGPVPDLFEVPPELAGTLRVVLLLIAAQVFVGIPAAALDDVYEGVERFDVRNLRSIVHVLLSAAVQATLLLLGFGIVALVAAQLVLSCLRLLVDLWLIEWLVPGLLRAPVGMDRRVGRRIRPFALWSWTDDLLAEGTSYLDDLLVALLLPIALLTGYAVSGSLADALALAVTPLLAVLFPMASRLHGRGALERVGKLLVHATRAGVALAAPLAIFLVFFGFPLLSLWVPEAARQATPQLLWLQLANSAVSVLVWPASIVLAAIGRVRALVLLLLAEVVLDVVLTLLLAPRYGLEGVAAAGLLSNGTMALLFELPLVAVAVGVRLAPWLGALCGRLALAGLPAVVLAWSLADSGLRSSWTGLAALAAAILALYAASAWVLGASATERRQLLDFVRGRFADRSAESPDPPGGAP